MYFIHTRAGGFRQWVCVDRKPTRAEAEARIPELQAQDDPMWAEAEYLISRSLHPLASEPATQRGPTGSGNNSNDYTADQLQEFRDDARIWGEEKHEQR